MRKEVEIGNKLGLHARPAALFVRCVIRCKSTITIKKGEEKFSAASPLKCLLPILDCGACVILEAIGPNELEALLLHFRDEEGGVQ
jgi:phosphocarrier protein HPr